MDKFRKISEGPEENSGYSVFFLRFLPTPSRLESGRVAFRCGFLTKKKCFLRFLGPPIPLPPRLPGCSDAVFCQIFGFFCGFLLPPTPPVSGLGSRSDPVFCFFQVFLRFLPLWSSVGSRGFFRGIPRIQIGWALGQSGNSVSFSCVLEEN